MARVQTGALVNDIRGSIGGTTFQRTGSGLVVHNKMSVPNFSTNAQTARRNLLASLQQTWMSLTEARRVAWQTWATYQSIKVKTFSTTGAYGQQAFLQANFYASLCGLPVLLDPVFSTYSLVFTGWRVTKYMTDSCFTPTTAESHSVYYPILKISSIQKPSLNTPRSQLTFMPPIYQATGTWRITEGYLAAYGQGLTIGDIVFVEVGFLQISNYALSSFQKSKTAVVALS